MQVEEEIRRAMPAVFVVLEEVNTSLVKDI
jgi:hypothetical protein